MFGAGASHSLDRGDACRPLPEGRPRIAQRFIAGFRAPHGEKSRRDERNQRPVAGSQRGPCFRPCGAWRRGRRSFPPLKRWAMVGRPLRDGIETAKRVSPFRTLFAACRVILHRRTAGARLGQGEEVADLRAYYETRDDVRSF